jgi:hypothetical protein
MSLKAGTERACMVAEETMNTAKARDPFARYENRESGRAAEILKRYEDEVRSGRGDQAVADIKPMDRFAN